MATIIFSPIISEARGKVSDVVFSVWKGRPYIRQRVIPANPQSAAQTLVRNSLSRVVQLWQSIEVQLKAVWNTYASGYQMSGFNMYMRQNRAQEQATSALAMTPANADIDAPATFTLSNNSTTGQLLCDWTGGTSGASNYMFMLARAETANVFTIGEKETTTVATLSSILSGLVASTTYDIYLFIEDRSDDTFSVSKFAQAATK